MNEAAESYLDRQMCTNGSREGPRKSMMATRDSLTLHPRQTSSLVAVSAATTTVGDGVAYAGQTTEGEDSLPTRTGAPGDDDESRGGAGRASGRDPGERHPQRGGAGRRDRRALAE